MYRFTIKIVLLSLLKFSSSSLCITCTCTKSGQLTVANCDKKLESNIIDLNLLLYLNNDPPDKFILSNNRFDETILEVLKDLKDLEVINLSHNYLNGSNIGVLKSMTKLDELNLSFNEWTTINVESLINIKSLSKLDLSHNIIENFTPTNSSEEHQLTYFYLSNNKLTTINEQLFNNFPNLQYLDLSFNLIESVEFNSFKNLPSLQTVLLKRNFLKILNINFSPSLKTLVVSCNQLTQFPNNLSVNSLSIDNNEISTISINNDEMYKQLKFLNISKNLLNNFIDSELSNLEILDISYNNFSTISPSINEKNLPKLDTLVISGNPINQLKFHNNIKLQTLIVRNLNSLMRIDEDAFNHLKEYDSHCINLSISSNKNLKFFDEKALDNVNICYLDLSDNALKQIPQHMKGLQDEFFFKYGLNLQGNPFVCNCSSQWMLDNLIPKLYDLNPELLANLRCHEPPELSNIRIVHWYKWKNQIFCDNNRSIFMQTVPSDFEIINPRSMTSMIVIESSNVMLLIITSCTVIVTILIVTGLILSLKIAHEKRKRNRRF